MLIKQIAFNWSLIKGDIFHDNQLFSFQEALEKHKYKYFDSKKEKEIIIFICRHIQGSFNEKLMIDGHRIHSFVDNIAKVSLIFVSK